MLGRFPYFIVNPRAGVGTGRYAMLKVEEIVRGGIGEMKVLRRGEDIAEAVEQALYQGATDIIAVGGDGTVGGVAGMLAGEEARFGIVPAGTANMFARELGLPLAIVDSLDLIMGKHDVRRIDVMDVNGRRFIHQVVLGASSEALSKVTAMEKRLFRRSVYALMGLRMFRDFQPMRVNARIDGHEATAGHRRYSWPTPASWASIPCASGLTSGSTTGRWTWCSCAARAERASSWPGCICWEGGTMGTFSTPTRPAVRSSSRRSRAP
ncbi:hypothetical protein AOA80_11255 [Methanomassiliicoccales archaeon RumEn M1]|nr:hypothetical protein AOA80_11255 [Methanomassiliicoccales archaeon RumEn M1]